MRAPCAIFWCDTSVKILLLLLIFLCYSFPVAHADIFLDIFWWINFIVVSTACILSNNVLWLWLFGNVLNDFIHNPFLVWLSMFVLTMCGLLASMLCDVFLVSDIVFCKRSPSHVDVTSCIKLFCTGLLVLNCTSLYACFDAPSTMSIAAAQWKRLPIKK